MNASKKQKLTTGEQKVKKATNGEKKTTNRKVKSTKKEELNSQDEEIENDIDNDNLPLNSQDLSSNNISSTILAIEQDLSKKLSEIKFRAPVDYIYNPVDYAYDVHSNYVNTYCQSSKKILLLGMNPGPWGMSQTGIPFGEISMAKEWLKMSGKIEKPPREHPERKITGFDCTRKEVSGLRFWGFFRELCKTPENFFRHSYVHNYCPLAFMASNAKNITPADLKTEEQKKVLQVCDEALLEVIKLLNVEIVIGIGRFAEERLKTVLKNASLDAKVIYMAHPSPRAVNNENWPEKAKKTLEDHKLLEFYSE